MSHYGYGEDEGFRSGTWADDFNTYEEACHYYGVDTPAQLEAEARYEEHRALLEGLDDMEARGGPDPRLFARGTWMAGPFARVGSLDDYGLTPEALADYEETGIPF